MVRDDELIELDMTVEAAFTLIISGGIVAPPNRLRNKNSQKREQRALEAVV